MAAPRANRAHQMPTMHEYDDHDLFGPRLDPGRSLDRLKAGNDSECIKFDIGTFSAIEKFKIKDLIGTDKRLRQMLQGLEIEHPWPIQRFSWPKIHRSTFTNVFISPEATGKTHALLLYLVSKCIAASPMNDVDELINSESSNQYVPKDISDLEELINHPKYIIISSSQDNVDMLKRKVDLMKEKAYGCHVTDAKRHFLAPVTRTINIQHDNDKLAFRCNESEIIISSPPALLRCLQEGFLDFGKCKKVFFDDLDIALQLQNNTIRGIIKIYLIQTHALTKLANTNSSDSTDTLTNGLNTSCQLHIFTRKWTELVRHFIGNIFTQRILLFASIAEAAIYNNLRFDVESCKDDQDRMSKISNLIGILVGNSPRAKIAIVCRTDEEAEECCSWLNEQGHKAKLLKDESDGPQTNGIPRISREIVFVISDTALDFEVEYTTRRKPLNDVMHLIHATIPEDMLTFDQRFRLLYKNIQDSKPEMTSTIMLSHKFKQNTARQIYDLISRSGPTLKSTKLIMRDFIANQTSHVCWRWATTGLCRLEKLSKDDRFGSYCFDRHAFGSTKVSNHWPQEGLVGMTLTHIVSPSEFYFRFEVIRSVDSCKWIKFDDSGKESMRVLQRKLDCLRNLPARSVELDRVKKGRIFGVHFPQECRVDRVQLLDDISIETKNAAMINKELEYSKQLRVFKIDYGSRLEVYVKNLIELPVELYQVPAQCHRGLHMGYKPTNNEPNWPYKSKKHFYETVSGDLDKSVGAWLRLNRDGCFWFENMHVSRQLENIDSDEKSEVNPHRELQDAGLAEATSAEPAGMPASNRIRIYSKWNHQKLTEASQFAFIDRDAVSSGVYLLNIVKDLEVLLRLTKYNKELIALENDLMSEFQNGMLRRQEYFAAGTICLARIQAASPDECINRVRIVETIQEQEEDIESPTSAPNWRVKVECLDHGDISLVLPDNLLKAEIAHIKRLPYQAIRRKLAHLNPRLLEDSAGVIRLKHLLFDLTRDSKEVNIEVQCKLNAHGDVYLYLPDDHKKNHYVPLYKRLNELNIELHLSIDRGFENDIEVEPEVFPADESDTIFFHGMLKELLCDMISNQLSSASVNLPIASQ